MDVDFRSLDSLYRVFVQRGLEYEDLCHAAIGFVDKGISIWRTRVLEDGIHNWGLTDEEREPLLGRGTLGAQRFPLLVHWLYANGTIFDCAFYAGSGGGTLSESAIAHNCYRPGLLTYLKDRILTDPDWPLRAGVPGDENAKPEEPSIERFSDGDGKGGVIVRIPITTTLTIPRRLLAQAVPANPALLGATTRKLLDGLREFDRLAGQAFALFKLKASDDYDFSYQVSSAPWLSLIYETLNPMPECVGAFAVRRLPGNVFRASALAIERLAPEGWRAPSAVRAAEPKEPERGACDVECFVTLQQAAAMVNRSKKTLERRKNSMPLPRVQGGGGKPDEWAWSELRPWLEKEFSRILPAQFPSSRFTPDRGQTDRR